MIVNETRKLSDRELLIQHLDLWKPKELQEIPTPTIAAQISAVTLAKTRKYFPPSLVLDVLIEKFLA